MEAVLQTYGLCKGYRRFTALEHVNMTVPKGAIYGLVGRNGAGKTTLIRVICGLQEPTAGTIACTGRGWGTRPSTGHGGGWARWWRPPPSTRT